MFKLPVFVISIVFWQSPTVAPLQFARSPYWQREQFWTFVVLPLLFLSTPYSISLVSDIQKWIPDSSLVTMRLSKTFPSTWNSVRNFKAHPIHSFQFVSVSCCNTHLMHTFDICRCSHKAVWIVLCVICVMCVPCCHLYLRISNDVMAVFLK